MRRPTGWIEDAVNIHWTADPHHTTVEYARLAALIKAGRDALLNLADNIEADPIADQEQDDLRATVKAGDELLEYLNPPSPKDDELPF